MTNEYIDWIEKSIVNGHINYYEDSDLEPVEHDPSEKVVYASWKHTKDIFTLKSFNNEKTTLKEVVNEV